MRYFIARKGARDVSSRVQSLKREEEKYGLNHIKSLRKFSDACEKSKQELNRLLESLNLSGKRVVGYAATSKSTTVLNYCGITSDQVEFIADTTPMKQGLYSPGMHIPIRPISDFRANYPDYALLFGWNHAEEIISKETDFKQKGGKWIVYVPQVGILNA